LEVEENDATCVVDGVVVVGRVGEGEVLAVRGGIEYIEEVGDVEGIAG